MAQVFVWIAASQPNGGYEYGEIIELFDDGVHAGNAVVNQGPLGWDGTPKIASLGILDVPATVAQITAAARAALPTLTVDQMRGLVRVDISRLPKAARDTLAASGRVSITTTQAASTVRRSLKQIIEPA